MSKKRALMVVLILLISVPLGLLSDADAWGEWGLEFYKEKLGFIPKGMEHFPNLVKPLLPDYTVAGTNSIFGYYASAVVGVGLVIVLWYLIGKVVAKSDGH